MSQIIVPITGLTAVNNSPTALGSLTTLTATLSTGSKVSYSWDFGDGSMPGTGAAVSYTYPLTGIGVVRRIYTDLAIIDVTAQSLEVVRLAPGIDFEYVQQRTEAELKMADIPGVNKTA